MKECLYLSQINMNNHYDACSIMFMLYKCFTNSKTSSMPLSDSI